MSKAVGGHPIGVVADRTGLPVETIRFYETSGLLAPQRDRSGHRRYDEVDIIDLEVIQALRQTGIPLKDIRDHISPAHEEPPLRHSLGEQLLHLLDQRADDVSRARELVVRWSGEPA